MFRYHNDVLAKRIEKAVSDLMDTCDGRKLSIMDVVKDGDGLYSEENFMKFLDDISVSDLKDSDMCFRSSEELKAEMDYIRTLLYVLIRSMEAGLNKIHATKSYSKAVSGDSFAELIPELRSYEVQLSMMSDEVKKKGLVSTSLKDTAETLYLMLSGKSLQFPDPYIEPLPEAASDASGVCEKVDPEKNDPGSEDDDPYLDMEDDGLFDYCDDPAMPDDSDYDYYMSLRSSEEEEYFHGDEKSHSDWEETLSEFASWEEQTQCDAMHFGPSDDPESMKDFQRESARIKMSFPEKDAFVRMYEHLAEITTPDKAGLESGLEHKINAWLMDSGKTIYSYDEACSKIMELLSGVTRKAHELVAKSA